MGGVFDPHVASELLFSASLRLCVQILYPFA